MTIAPDVLNDPCTLYGAERSVIESRARILGLYEDPKCSKAITGMNKKAWADFYGDLLIMRKNSVAVAQTL